MRLPQYLLIILIIYCWFHNMGTISSKHRVDQVRKRFLKDYQQTCLSLPFIQRYLEKLQNLTLTTNDEDKKKKKYAIFVFHDSQKARIGGLGDRFVGLISVFFYALRTNRILLIEDSSGMISEYFTPYPYYHSHMHNNNNNNNNQSISWSNWQLWSQLQEHIIPDNRKQYQYCINPKPKMWNCALEYEDHSQLFDFNSRYDLIRFRLNRGYLCRWLLHPTTFPHTYQSLLSIITPDSTSSIMTHNLTTSNLLLWNGCILRTLLWPTTKLWNQVKHYYNQTTTTTATSTPSTQQRFVKSEIPYPYDYYHQIGIHFRCGDHASYGYATIPIDPQYRACHVINYTLIDKLRNSHTINTSWHGTRAIEEWSASSPIDVAICALQRSNALTLMKNKIQRSLSAMPMHHHHHHHHHVVFYIASDSDQASKQIHQILTHQLDHYTLPNLTLPPTNQTNITWAYDIRTSPPGCHIDYNRSTLCSAETLFYWFLLAISDEFIVQSHTEEDGEVYPVSSFSRTALWYRLPPTLSSSLIYNRKHSQRFEDYVYYAENCTASSMKMSQKGQLGQTAQGPWVCTGDDIY
jgi:hypothetical protein